MPNDIAMFVGVSGYPWPKDFSDEARVQGVSKAIPRTAIPYIEPGKTRLVLLHPRADIRAKNLVNLGLELVNEYVVGTDREPLVEEKKDLVSLWEEGVIDDWPLAYALQVLTVEGRKNKLAMCDLLREADMVGDLSRLEKEHEIKYYPAFFGYTYLTGVQYVLKDGEEELPPELVGTGAVPIRVEYYEEET